MKANVSRRTLLRTGMLAGATLPFLRLNEVLAQFETDQAGTALRTMDGRPVIRLSHNENPFGPPESARKAIIEAIAEGNRYPREGIAELREKIAAREGLTTDHILIGAGSTEILGIAGLMAGIDRGKIIACHPTFDFLMYYAQQFAAEWVKVPVTDAQQYDLAGINRQLDDDTRMVFICNPNNPTGAELPRSMLEPFCSVVSQRCMVFVDEAYIELAKGGVKVSLAPLTRDNRNVIVSRTFSKIYGMAGLRVGYAIAHPDTIARLRPLMMSRMVSPAVTSVAAASAALDDTAFRDYSIEMNTRALEVVYDAFDRWGVEYIPSSTNFLLFRTTRFGDTDITEALARQQIMIRSYRDVPGWARVSMGTLDEMQQFVRATERHLTS